MIKKAVSSAVAKLQRELAAARKNADQAKKKAKLAKLAYRAAKDRLKDCKHAAKKLRKAVKGLEEELAAAKRKDGTRKPATRTAAIARKKLTAQPTPVPAEKPMTPAPTAALVATENPAPAQ
jgi:chromosome segregation ATPase